MFQRRIKSEIHKEKFGYWELNSSKNIPGLGEYDLGRKEKDFAAVSIVKNVTFRWKETQPDQKIWVRSKDYVFIFKQTKTKQIKENSSCQ